ncbi:MAG: hypothetical protein ABIQ04_03385 [Candidatus Saccharimonadales bacterium]
MIHDYINPSSTPFDNTDATAMTHRTANQSFNKRREIENNRSTIGSYEDAATKARIEAHKSMGADIEPSILKTDYYSEVRESLGIKSDIKRNPYRMDRQENRTKAGRTDKRPERQSSNSKTGGLTIPKRPSTPAFREPQGRSFNPFS